MGQNLNSRQVQILWMREHAKLRSHDHVKHQLVRLLDWTKTFIKFNAYHGDTLDVISLLLKGSKIFTLCQTLTILRLLVEEDVEAGGVGIREPKIRDEWQSRWGIMENSPVSEGLGSRGNSEEGRFRPDELESWLSTLLLWAGSGSASKSSTWRGEWSNGRAGEVRRGKTMNREQSGAKEMTEELREREGCRGKEKRMEAAFPLGFI